MDQVEGSIGGVGVIHQISAAEGAGGEFCVVTADDYWHYSEVYEASIWGWQDMQNQADYVAAANDGIVFTVESYPNRQIWCHDPQNDWADAWGYIHILNEHLAFNQFDLEWPAIGTFHEI